MLYIALWQTNILSGERENTQTCSRLFLPKQYRGKGLLHDAGHPKGLFAILHIIIQQIVTLSKYGHEALDICHP